MAGGRGYDGKDKGKDWVVEKILGFSAEIVKRPRRWVSKGVRRRGAAALPEGLHRLAAAVGGGAKLLLEHQNRRMSKDYERVPETGEALLYVAMTRLMVRRLARL